MRPLPDLTILDTQPSVFDQSTDDWNTLFANEFTSTDSQQAILDQTVPGIYTAMDPLSQAIDAIGGLLDDAVNILSILSGDLDTVDLTPDILYYQQADAEFSTNLDSFTLDTTSIGLGLFNDIMDVMIPTLASWFTPVIDVINQMFFMLQSVQNQISLLWQYVE